MEQNTAPIHSLPPEFLAQLLPELEHEDVRAIILRGSYARGDAFPPYSDIDLTLIVYDGAEKCLFS